MENTMSKNCTERQENDLAYAKVFAKYYESEGVHNYYARRSLLREYEDEYLARFGQRASAKARRYLSRWVSRASHLTV